MKLNVSLREKMPILVLSCCTVLQHCIAHCVKRPFLNSCLFKSANHYISQSIDCGPFCYHKDLDTRHYQHISVYQLALLLLLKGHKLEAYTPTTYTPAHELQL